MNNRYTEINKKEYKCYRIRKFYVNKKRRKQKQRDTERVEY